MRSPSSLPRFFLAATALCLTLCAAPFPAFADPAASAKTHPFPFQSVIVSLNPAARTFCMGKKVRHQVHVLPETKITQGDTVPVTFQKLAVGTEIRGSVRKRADGDYDAVSVKIGTK